MASHAEIKAALRATKGDVSAAFENVQAAGRATEALKDDFAKIERLRAELRQAEINYAEQAKALAKRKAEKEEARRIAVQIAKDLSRSQADATISDADDIDLTTVVDSNVVWGQSNPNFRLSPETMETVLHLVKTNLGVQETRDRAFGPPFWFSDENIGAEYLKSIKISRHWRNFDKLGEERYYLKRINYEKNEMVFRVPGWNSTYSTNISFVHGVLVAQKTRELGRLIEENAVERYEFAKKLDEAFLQAVISIIPGTFGFEKQGKGRIIQPGVFEVVNVKGDATLFSFSYGEDDKPVLMYGFAKGFFIHFESTAYQPKASFSALTRATYDNVMKLLMAWEELYIFYHPLRSTLNKVSKSVWRKEMGFSPHVTVMDTLEEDTKFYITQEIVENDKAKQQRQQEIALDRAAEQNLQERIAKEGIKNGSLMKSINTWSNSFLIPKNQWVKDRGFGSRYYDFYRVVPEGEITDGKGNLIVQGFKEEWKEGIRGLPSMADLQPRIFSKSGLEIVTPDEMEFLSKQL